MAKRTRRPAAERREEIARAALRIAGERGLPALTTAALAAEVGLTTGALFRHFASVDEILLEAARYGVARIDETFPDPAAPPLERLLELARNRVRLLGGDPSLAWLVRSEQAHLALPEEGVALLRDLVKRSRAFLLAALRDGAAAGVIRDDVEPELLLVPVMGTIHTLIGMPGVHGAAARRRHALPERVLEALALVLAPPRRAPATRASTSRRKRS